MNLHDSTNPSTVGCEAKMTASFLDEAHKARFAFFSGNDPDDFNTLLAIDYILTAYGDPLRSLDSIAEAAKEAQDGHAADKNNPADTDKQLLFSFLKDIASATTNVSLIRLLIPDMTSDKAFFLIVNALLIMRYGRKAINPQDLTIKDFPL